jgi:hypothetical protein
MELFKNPHDALVFGLNFSSQQYALSPMSKMLKGGGGSGKGLVALDGSGQAGMIRARIERMGDPLQKASIIARYAARTEDCPCCGNQKMLSEYKEALMMLSTWAAQFVSGSANAHRLRFGVVQAYFDKKTTISKLAESLGTPKRTAYDQKARIWPELSKLDKAAQECIGDMLADLCGDLPD